MNNLFITVFLLLIPILVFLVGKRRRSVERLPPGSLGLPIIGQSLGLLSAMKANTGEKWFEKKIKKYGPMMKLNLFGKPTIFIYGQAANKFIFSSDGSTTVYQQTKSTSMIFGERSLFGLTGQDHKRVRQALLSFLKPESLKEYVGKMDEEVNKHLEMHWQGKQELTVLPLMKNLTFNIICSLLFGLEKGPQRDEYVHNFQEMMGGVWSVPINLPFTRYNRSLRATARVRKMLKDLVHKKRVQLEQMVDSPRQDLITHLLSIRGENNEQVITEKEIIHNTVLVMIAGHDTTSILLTFLIQVLANNPAVYAGVLQEQEEIAKGKSTGELLRWEDVTKMKFTWRVAMETLRTVPPVFGGFRRALEDIEYGGYIIPKGWQIFWVTNMTHMDDSIFPEPSKFDPSRFENQASVPPYSFVGFGGGPRLCPGNEFAKIETLVAIHYLVKRFKWKLCADNLFSRDPMPKPTKGLPIKISARKLK